MDLEKNKKITYQLLGPDDADYEMGSISIHSPIGNAILGSQIGDKIEVTVPRGDLKFEVLEINPPELD